MTTTTKTEMTAPVSLPGTETLREVAGNVGGALTAGGKAYYAGLYELGRTLGGFGREFLTEAGEHARATMKAKCLGEVSRLQAAYAQHRIEMAATHTKEFVDLARVKSEEVIAPIAGLLKQDNKA